MLLRAFQREQGPRAYAAGGGAEVLCVQCDQASGDVTILLNDATHSFAQEDRFVASTGLSGVDTSSGTAQVSSLNQSVSLVRH